MLTNLGQSDNLTKQRIMCFSSLDEGSSTSLSTMVPITRVNAKKRSANEQTVILHQNFLNYKSGHLYIIKQNIELLKIKNG